MSDMIFYTLKIPADRCLELDTQTGRYDKKELLVKPNTDLSNALTPDAPKIY